MLLRRQRARVQAPAAVGTTLSAFDGKQRSLKKAMPAASVLAEHAKCWPRKLFADSSCVLGTALASASAAVVWNGNPCDSSQQFCASLHLARHRQKLHRGCMSSNVATPTPSQNTRRCRSQAAKSARLAAGARHYHAGVSTGAHRWLNFNMSTLQHTACCTARPGCMICVRIAHHGSWSVNW